MTTLLLLAAALAAGPDGDWKFVDEASRDGRSVLTFRAVGIADAPTRPLHADDAPPAGSKFGSVGLGPGGKRRLAVVWHAASDALWFDADGDGRFAASERHALTSKPVEAKVTVPSGDGAGSPRTLLLKRRGDGVAWAVRGYTTGRVAVAGKAVAAMLTDGDGDGNFDAPGADRVWLDLDGDGRFDPLTEQFPLGTAVSAAGTALLLSPRPDGLGVRVRERPSESGTLRVEVATRPGAEVVELHANYVSEFGELVAVESAGVPVPLPAGKYRVDSVRLKLAAADGKVWHYAFASDRRAYDLEVKHRRRTDHPLLDGLKVTIEFDAGAGAAAGGSVQVQPDVSAGGLCLTSCEVGSRFDDRGRDALAEFRLAGPGSVVLDRCTSGFH